MTKQIIDFNAGDRIELSAVQLSPEENKEVRQELKKLKADIHSVDSECVRAEITGDQVDYAIVEKLEFLGWEF